MNKKMGSNRNTLLLTVLMAFLVPVVLGGCAGSSNTNNGLELPELSSDQADDERGEVASREGEGEHGGERSERSGEHGGEGREGAGEHGGERGEEGGEHGGEHSGEGEEGGEESGTEFGLNDTYDNVRNGARLILKWDAESSSFVGTVENTTDETLKRVRVEVHLSNGIELGPTTTADIEPGKKRRVRLTATSTDFDAWSAHPEVGAGEHGGENA